ncbi:hypothetical protein C6Y44_27920 (plasmid) [Rhodococcus rhodochrous]|nr:hypothetical protein C6Y44_27920 [Rhodococcus rhodochrous]
MDVEVWVPVKGYEGHYEVSTHGRVKSLTRTLPHAHSGTKTYPETILSPAVAKKGHLQVGLNLDGKRRTVLVHHLVAEAFLGERPEGLQVRHLDGNPANNHVTNLLWGTGGENNRDAVRHGTHYAASKTECPRGHLLVPPNLVPSLLKKGRRDCLACSRARPKVRSNPDLDLQTVADDYYRDLIPRKTDQ